MVSSLLEAVNPGGWPGASIRLPPQKSYETRKASGTVSLSSTISRFRCDQEQLIFHTRFFLASVALQE